MAAEYIKLWTAFLDDDWVQSLSCTQRGVFIQLLLTCRKNGDISTTYHRSARTLAGLFGLDVGTLSKTLRNFDADGKIKFSQDEKGVYRIEVCNYHFWQGLKGEKGVSETVKKRRSDVEKSVGNRPSKPSQEKPSQEITIVSSSNGSDHRALIDFWMIQYQEKTGVKYLFQSGKDGAAVKRVLSQLKSLDLAKAFVADFFDNPDDFILNKSGFSISVFSTQLNKIAQRLSTTRQKDESEIDRHNRRAAEEYLKQFDKDGNRVVTV